MKSTLIRLCLTALLYLCLLLVLMEVVILIYARYPPVIDHHLWHDNRHPQQVYSQFTLALA